MEKNRIHKIKAVVDELIVLFPFEVEYFLREKLKTHCFGHPLLEYTKPNISKEEFLQRWDLSSSKKLVSILPGSRRNEILKHLPTLVEMAEILSEEKDDIQLVIPLAPTVKKRNILPYLKDKKVKITIVENDTYNCIFNSDLAIVTSGTATLETAILQTPLIVIYRVSLLTYLVGKYIFGIRTIGLPNIVSGREIVPEMTQWNFTPSRLAAKVLEIFDNPEIYQKIKTDLKQMKESLGTPGSYNNTAKFISHELG